MRTVDELRKRIKVWDAKEEDDQGWDDDEDPGSTDGEQLPVEDDRDDA